MTMKLLTAFLLSLGVTAVCGLVLVPLLRRKKAGQMIREDGPVWHRSKQGTPTMGGLMFIIGIAVTCVTVGFGEMRQGELGHIYILVFALIFAFIGFLDDYEKLVKKRNLGLTALQKFLLQLAAAVVFVLLMRLTGHLTPNLYIPFWNVSVIIPEPVYFVLAAFVIVGTVNAVNITDGVDGLATGVSIPVAVCYGAVAVAWGLTYTYLGIVAAALCGGLIGFLLFNFHPARVFMGDTGSLFLGGIICAMAFAMDAPLILVPLGIVYIVETLSDIIQIVYFKATKGKRIFKMAPLHHHFEMSGWSEYKLFAVFTLVSAIFAVVSFFAVSARFSL
ncbi:Phospho-N-acetylmuramoyl-pentapeptide-transferase [Sporobacter termitidis DSM 10068]|uniref:Phospho-N-acetylmuramoyl-pentapeptide-transferase n=1 Tax=Sporobacter termitidis DSM 10068 TaxID=1123282 RepID=A0A1M5WZT5_9FIRM|nr:phospho-N-acetylmuramoyl-pentapeptide-transferase [Sporobacter termitidis]SHH92882.1 Phospho-N-acetylmuramoyl-pentapeptide-transferase [Sporobacter termitidis DSM 10068]